MEVPIMEVMNIMGMHMEGEESLGLVTVEREGAVAEEGMEVVVEVVEEEEEVVVEEAVAEAAKMKDGMWSNGLG